MLVNTASNDQSQKLVEVKVALRVCYAFGLNDQQTLERVYYFLNMLPLVGTLP